MRILESLLWLRKGLETSLNIYPSLNNLCHPLHSRTLRLWTTTCPRTKAVFKLVSEHSLALPTTLLIGKMNSTWIRSWILQFHDGLAAIAIAHFIRKSFCQPVTQHIMDGSYQKPMWKKSFFMTYHLHLHSSVHKITYEHVLSPGDYICELTRVNPQIDIFNLNVF